MVSLFRRYFLILALMFWQGGFTFHGLVVVHVGHQILGSRMEQGYITGAASNYLNLAGAFALGMWGWDIACGGRKGLYRLVPWGIWIVLVLCLVILAIIHARLDGLMDVDSFAILDRPQFYELHRWYLHVSTVQWAGCLLLIGETLLAWRKFDQALV